MTNYLRLSLYAALTIVLLCLVRSGLCYDDAEFDVEFKQDTPISRTVRNSKDFGAGDFDRFTQGRGPSRSRTYFTGKYKLVSASS